MLSHISLINDCNLFHKIFPIRSKLVISVYPPTMFFDSSGINGKGFTTVFVTISLLSVLKISEVEEQLVHDKKFCLKQESRFGKLNCNMIRVYLSTIYNCYNQLRMCFMRNKQDSQAYSINWKSWPENNVKWVLKVTVIFTHQLTTGSSSEGTATGAAFFRVYS